MATPAEKQNGFTKNYIGKGKQVKDFDITNVTIEMDDIEKYIHEFQGKKYLTFDVARMKEPDQFGKTHSVYVTTKNE